MWDGPVINASANAFLGTAILVWVWRTHKRTGYRLQPALMGVFGLWLLAAAVARWAHGAFGPSPWVSWVQTYAWVPRYCAAIAVVWRESLNGHYETQCQRALRTMREDVRQARHNGA